jgi:predicted MFS family arabinose efflux permease
LLGIWSVGSLAGGVFTARLGGGARGAVGLSLILAALACGHVTAAVASGDLVALAIALLIAGTALAPTFASAYAMVDRVAPAGSVTEAFAWLATALAVGGAAGSALAGVLADRSGPSDAFVLAGAAGIAAALTTVLRARTLGEIVEPQGTQPATA